MAEESVPDQPDGIESESFDLPTPWAAAKRVGEYLDWWGDGLIDTAGPNAGNPAAPLYARDLQSLVNAQRAKSDKVDLLLWLHAEASYWLALDRDEHESADALDAFHRRAVYAEQRYGWAKQEIYRLRREVGFEANGVPVVTCEAGRRDNLRYPLCACLTEAQTAVLHAANEVNVGGPQWTTPRCAVHPSGSVFSEGGTPTAGGGS